ncbi:amidase [Rhodococcus koreensis]
MTVAPPTRHEVRDLATRLELGITDDELPSYANALEGVLGSWNVVEKLYSEFEHEIPAREWSYPMDGENSFGAWYVRTKIQTTESGPLAGRTVAVKDNIAVAGVPMMNGSRTLEGFVPRRDATVVSRLLAAGAIISGKSVCEDLCFSGGSHTSKPGPVSNPWNPAHCTGGSSSGTAAIVASGDADLGMGGDQGGSVRGPAAFCGIVGHKPTHGLVPYTGAFPIEQSIDHLGPMTRTVADAALMLDVISGSDGNDPRQSGLPRTDSVLEGLNGDTKGLRIGVVRQGFGHANSDPAVDSVVRIAVDQLVAAGMVAEEVSIPWHDHGSKLWDVISVEGAVWQMLRGNGYGLNWRGLYDPDLIATYGAGWRKDPSQFSETVKLVALGGEHTLNKYYGRHYAMARNLEKNLTAAYDVELARFDVLVMPTDPIVASRLPAPNAPVEVVLDRALEMLSNTSPFNVTGHPACSVPAGLAHGLPVGLMIVGQKFADATVLKVAHAFEAVVGGFRTPAQTK